MNSKIKIIDNKKSEKSKFISKKNYLEDKDIDYNNINYKNINEI